MQATRGDIASAVSSLLFPAAYRRRVLSLLLLNPGKAFHARELARLTVTPAGTLNKELTRLHAAGLLTRERVGNQLRYSAQTAHPVFPELSALLRKTVGLAYVLADALAPLADQIDIAFVFGSMAKGTDVAGSDIDLMLIGKADYGAVIDALAPAERQLARPINAKPFTRGEWRARLRAADSFVDDVLRGPKIFLVGGERELGALDWRKR